MTSRAQPKAHHGAEAVSMLQRRYLVREASALYASPISTPRSLGQRSGAPVDFMTVYLKTARRSLGMVPRVARSSCHSRLAT